MSVETVAYVVSGSGIINLILNGKSFTVSTDHANYKQVKEALHTKNVKLLLKLVDIPKAITAYTKSLKTGKVTVEGGEVLYNGEPMHTGLTSRMLALMNQGFPFAHMARFLENLMSNVSKRAIDELYDFLEHRAMPLTEDGCFLAYKSVGSDWLSKTSGSEDVEVSTDGGKTWKVVRGRIPNHVGTIVRMTRNLVDDEKDRTCSHGLHVGALAYAGPGGWFNSSNDKVVIVKVNPANAVSVPSDHSAQKLRVCEYEVVDTFKGEMDKPLYATTQDGAAPCEPKSSLSPYHEGYEAYSVGTSLNSNPYDIEEDCEYDAACDWEDGWLEAQDDSDYDDASCYYDEEDAKTKSCPNYHNKRDANGRFTKK